MLFSPPLITRFNNTPSIESLDTQGIETIERGDGRRVEREDGRRVERRMEDYVLLGIHLYYQIKEQ